MVKSVKYLIFVGSLFLKSTLFCMQTTFGTQPTGMQPAGAVAISQSGLINYTVKPNIKNISTNNPAVEASVIDLSDSMKSSQRRIFEAYGLIPMSVTVKNNLARIIHVAPEVLDYGIGLSLDGAKDAIIRNFKLKKYGTYASMVTYKAIILASLISAGLYFPYAGAYSLSNSLLTYVMSSGATWASACSLLSQIPAGVKCLTGAASLCLALAYFEPSMFVNKFHGLVDKYYRMKATCRAPLVNINELNQAIDFVVTSSNNQNFDVVPNSSRQFLIFVRSADATGIKNGTTFPVLKFE